MGLCRYTLYSLRNFLIFFFAVALLPGLPPKTHFEFESFTATPPRELTGRLAPNNLLDKATRLYEDRVSGPECLLSRGNDIYASQRGQVVKINGEHITHVARFGKACEPHEEEICGRPLGMAFDTISNSLIVADAYYGIWSVDLTSLKKTQLVSADEILEGKIHRKAKIFNSVAVAKNGDIYWTDSASDFNLINGVNTFLANPSGRLFHYTRASRANRLLIDQLHFTNGLTLSPNEDFVVVAESAQARLQKYYLTGPKAGTKEIFVDGLPGVPDNLSSDAEGIWVPLVTSRDTWHPALWLTAGPTPIIRKFVIRFVDLLEQPFRLIHKVYPTIYTQLAMNKIGSFELLSIVKADRTTILRVDWNGNIVSALHGFDKTVSIVAHVLELNGYLYLGSFSNNFIGRIKLPSNFERGTAPAQPQDARPTTAAPHSTAVPTTTRAQTTTTTTTPAPTTTTTTTTPAPTTTTTTTPAPTTTTTTRAPTTTTTTTRSPTTTTTTTRAPATTQTTTPAPTQKPAPATSTTTVPPVVPSAAPTATKPTLAPSPPAAAAPPAPTTPRSAPSASASRATEATKPDGRSGLDDSVRQHSGNTENIGGKQPKNAGAGGSDERADAQKPTAVPKLHGQHPEYVRDAKQTVDAGVPRATVDTSAPPPPLPPTPVEHIPIHEQHTEETRPPRPEKMKIIKRGGEQGEF